MGDLDATEGTWTPTPRQVQDLTQITTALLEAAHLAGSGNDLIALGEAVSAMEALSDGEPVEFDVRVTVGFRRGDEDLREGLFIDAYVNDTGVVLGETRTTYSRAVGGDHESEEHARIGEEAGGRRDGVAVWLARFADVARQDDAKLTVERNHV